MLMQDMGIYLPFLRLKAYLSNSESIRQYAEELCFYKSLLKSGCLAFDIGANHGGKTEILRCCASKVIAVEPQESCFDALTLKFSGDPRVVLIQGAVADKAGTGVLYIGSHDTVSTLCDEFVQVTKASNRLPGIEWANTTEVPTVTLDELTDTYGIPDFCKIDVEGLELEVLEGLSSPIPLLAFEITRDLHSKSLGCIRRLAQLGQYEFNCTGILGVPRFLNRRWLRTADFCDFVDNWPLSSDDANKVSQKLDVYARRVDAAHG